MAKEPSALEIERNIGNFAYPETHTHDAGVGLTEKTIHYISDIKEDPDWVRQFRLNAYKTFMSKPMPTHWASKDLEAIVFDNIRYYLSANTWQYYRFVFRFDFEETVACAETAIRQGLAALSS